MSKENQKMYHARFKKSHDDADYKWWSQLLKNGSIIKEKHTFQIGEERKKFALECLPIYKKYYPEILEEILGIAEGQQMDFEDLFTFFASMYCFEFNNHCTCFAWKDEDHILFARNSDF